MENNSTIDCLSNCECCGTCGCWTNLLINVLTSVVVAAFVGAIISWRVTKKLNNNQTTNSDNYLLSVKDVSERIPIYMMEHSPFREKDSHSITNFLEERKISPTPLINQEDAHVKSQPILCARYASGRLEADICGICGVFCDEDLRRTVVLVLQTYPREHGHIIDPVIVNYRDNQSINFKNVYGIFYVNATCIAFNPCVECSVALDKLIDMIKLKHNYQL
ncbi:uncharacterized protein LOC128554021 [Mercenaria mercenaria]|uniref:uncharacterized protein LOC128554021 n=1 Tax=Mercenaria mercenaria TaxID=6596 RepID=UPI00234F21D2|nr:uncharacterized protein LOC128554021 [Mercenaria mercenaria]